MKVANFGRSELIVSHIYNAKEKMNIKWMAPETLVNNEFSLKSDIWGEIYSYHLSSYSLS